MQELQAACCSPTTTAPTAGCSRRVCEMAFAGRCGVTVSLDALAFDAVDRRRRRVQARRRGAAGRARCKRARAAGAVRRGARRGAADPRRRPRPGDGGAARGRPRQMHCHVIGQLNATRRDRDHAQCQAGVHGKARSTCSAPGRETSFRMQQLRDNPECAQRGIRPHPGCRMIRVCLFQLTFDIKNRSRFRTNAQARASRSCASRA